MDKHDVIKLVALGFAAIVFFSGCSTTNITRLTNALAKDGAVVQVKVSSVYGTISVTRVGPQTNGNASVTPDGVVTVKSGQ